MCTVELPKQVTVAIIKPDAVEAGLVDEIIQKVFTVLCQILVSGVLTDAFFLIISLSHGVKVESQVCRVELEMVVAGRWGRVDSGIGLHVHEKELALSFNKRVCL